MSDAVPTRPRHTVVSLGTKILKIVTICWGNHNSLFCETMVVASKHVLYEENILYTTLLQSDVYVASITGWRDFINKLQNWALVVLCQISTL